MHVIREHSASLTVQRYTRCFSVLVHNSYIICYCEKNLSAYPLFELSNYHRPSLVTCNNSMRLWCLKRASLGSAFRHAMESWLIVNGRHLLMHLWIRLKEGLGLATNDLLCLHDQCSKKVIWSCQPVDVGTTNFSPEAEGRLGVACGVRFLRSSLSTYHPLTFQSHFLLGN